MADQKRFDPKDEKDPAGSDRQRARRPPPPVKASQAPATIRIRPPAPKPPDVDSLPAPRPPRDPDHTAKGGYEAPDAGTADSTAAGSGSNRPTPKPRRPQSDSVRAARTPVAPPLRAELLKLGSVSERSDTVRPDTRPTPLTPPPIPLDAQRSASNRHSVPGRTSTASSWPPAPPDRAFVAEAQEMLRRLRQELVLSSTDRRQARVHFEIARLREHPFGDLDRAEVHYREALKGRPEYLPALRGLRRVLLARRRYDAALRIFDAEAKLLADAEHRAALLLAKGRVLEDHLGRPGDALEAYVAAHELDRSNLSILHALEQRYAADGAWLRLDQTLEQTANASNADPHFRSALIARRATIAETRLKDVDKAIELYETALRIDPTSQIVRRALERLHRKQHRWRDLIRILELEAAQSEDPARQALALYRAGRLHAEHLGNRKEAIAALESAGQRSQHDPLILSDLARLYREDGQPEALVRVLKDLGESEPDGGTAASIFHTIGHLYETDLSDEASAVEWYGWALMEAPTSVPTLQALGRLHTRAGRWEELVAMLLREASYAEDPERRAAAHCRVGEVLETRLNNRDGAIEQHLRALTSSPLHPPSFKAATRLLAAAGRWHRLIELHEQAAEIETNPHAAIAHLFRVGWIYEEWLQEPAQAIHAYRSILSLDPDHLGGIHALQRAAERAERHEDLVEALELEASKITSVDQVVALLHRSGDLLAEALGRRDEAIERYEKVLHMQPGHRPSLASLGRLHFGAGRWDALLEIYRHELETLSDDAEAASLLHKMGNLCRDRIGNDDAALGFYNQAVERMPSFAPAGEDLSRMLLDREDFAELARVLELRMSALEEPAARSRHALALAVLREDRLRDDAGAAEAYEQAIAAVDGHRAAIHGLTQLRSRLGAHEKALKDLDREIDTTQDPATVAALRVEQARIYSEHLDRPDQAIPYLQRALEEQPRDLSTLLAIESLYRKAADSDELVDILSREGELITSAAARIKTLRERIRLQSRLPHDAQQAVSSCWALLELNPTDIDAAQTLERLAIDLGDEALLERVDAHIVSNFEDSEFVATHRVRFAQALESADDPRALQAYRDALELDAEDLAAVMGLHRVATTLDDPQAIAEAAIRWSSVAVNGEQAAELLVEAATIREEQLDDAIGALGLLEEALDRWAGSLTAAARLATLSRKLDRLERATSLITQAASRCPQIDAAIELWLLVADLQADELDSPAAAISSLLRIHKIRPADIRALERLATLSERLEQWHDATRYLEALLARTDDAEPEREIRLRLARIYDEALNAAHRARPHLDVLLTVDPEDTDALYRICRIEEKSLRLDEALELAHRWVAAASTSEGRASALMRVAELAIELGKRKEGIEALSRAVAHEGPGTPAARAFKAEASTADDWSVYCGALRRYIDDATIARVTESYRELAEVLAGPLDDTEEALRSLRQGLEETASSPVLRGEIVRILQRSGRHDEALDQLHRLLDLNVERADTWRGAVESYKFLSRPRETRLALAALEALGQAQPAETELLHHQGPKLFAATHTVVDRSTLDRLLQFSDEARRAVVLLRALEPALAKLYPFRINDYGVSSRDRLTTRTGHPLRRIADRVATIVGLKDFDLYMHTLRGRGVSVELSNPVSIFLPPWIQERTPSEQIFIVAQPLVKAAMGLQATDKLTPRELEVLLASAARTVSPNAGGGLTSEDLLDEQSRRIQRALPRRIRNDVNRAASDYVLAGHVGFRRFCQRTKSLSIQLATLLSDDLVGSLAVLKTSEKELQNVDTAELCKSSDLVLDLLRFWISNESLELREKLALL